MVSWLGFKACLVNLYLPHRYEGFGLPVPGGNGLWSLHGSVPNSTSCRISRRMRDLLRQMIWRVGFTLWNRGDLKPKGISLKGRSLKRYTSFQWEKYYARFLSLEKAQGDYPPQPKCDDKINGCKNI